jgi:hypothetical protein
MGKRPFQWKCPWTNPRRYTTAEARNAKVRDTHPSAVSMLGGHHVEIRDSPSEPWRPFKEMRK